MSTQASLFDEIEEPAAKPTIQPSSGRRDVGLRSIEPSEHLGSEAQLGSVVTWHHDRAKRDVTDCGRYSRIFTHGKMRLGIFDVYFDSGQPTFECVGMAEDEAGADRLVEIHRARFSRS